MPSRINYLIYRLFWGGLVLIIFGIFVFFTLAPGFVERAQNGFEAHDPYPVSAEAKALHQSLFIGDWHADSLLWRRNLNRRAARGHVDFPRLREGNVALQVFTAVTKSPTGQNYDQNEASATDNITRLAVAQRWPRRSWRSLVERALHQAAKLNRFVEESNGTVRLVTDRKALDDFVAERMAGADIIAAILGIEGAHALEGDLDNLDRLEAAGYRVIGLQHFFDNALGGSLHGTSETGLTDFGRKVVREVSKRNMVLDLAHSSEKVARDVLKMTDMPVIVSHTGVYSHHPVKRNFPDALMKEIAATGGVIGIGYWADVTGDDSPQGIARTIRAAIDLLGEDHVSLGSDYDGAVTVAFDTSELAALTQALMDEGLSAREIRKAMGENMLRVLRARL